MPESLYSESFLPKGEVGSVSEEPLEKFRILHRERMFRFWAVAFFGLVVVLLCIYILIGGNAEVHEFRSAAWGFLSALGGGFVVYMTGASSSAHPLLDR